MDFDNLKYIANIERGGLYKVVSKCTSNKMFTLECIYGKGVENEDDYNSGMHCNDTQIEELIEENFYVPMFSEQEVLAWKLKYAS